MIHNYSRKFNIEYLQLIKSTNFTSLVSWKFRCTSTKTSAKSYFYYSCNPAAFSKPDLKHKRFSGNIPNICDPEELLTNVSAASVSLMWCVGSAEFCISAYILK